MDSGTIIITIIFLVIVTLPFVLNVYSKQRKRGRLLKKIKQMADDENCCITHFDSCHNFIIGLDCMANHLFFYKIIEQGDNAQSYDLKDFKYCRVYNSKRGVHIKNDYQPVIEKIGLTLIPLVKSESDIFIEFYNNAYDSLTLSGELELVEKWGNRINKIVNN